METIEEYLARGGKIEKVPQGRGKAQEIKGKRGEALRLRLNTEAQAALVAKKRGSGNE